MGRNNQPWYRKSTRSWYVWHDGKQVRLAGDKKEAWEAWHRLYAQSFGLTQVDSTGEQPPTVSELVERYWQAKLPQWKPRTAVRKREILDALVYDHAPTPASHLDLLAWLNSRPTWGRTTRWFASCCVKSMFRWANLPFDPVALPGPVSRGSEALISPDHHAQILSATPHPEVQDALSFLYVTGCRPSEMASIEAASIDANTHTASLWVHKTDTNGHPRVLLLPEDGPIWECICRLMRRHPVGPVFRTPKGLNWTHWRLNKHLWTICKGLNIPVVSSYSYRHTFATDALANGVGDALVARLLGHSNTNMIHKHYSHLSERLNALKEAQKKARGTS